jgi:benzylsuccinate CoA-transferase BbsF subunit
MTALPLRGVRVVNFGWVWAGPVVGQTLGFLGAEVLKIETRSRLDPMRRMPPFQGGTYNPDRSYSNHACWAGNGSVSLNLKEPEALDLARRLIARSDVVIENFSPGVIDRLGLGYSDLRAIKDDIIMLSMPAAGLSGPMKDVRTYGTTLTALTGLDSVTGYKHGEPAPVENAFSDPYTGILAAFAIVAALRHHRRSGVGQHIELSQQEAILPLMSSAFMDYIMNGVIAGPKGNEHPQSAAAPHGVFRCRGDDRWVSIVCYDDSEWRSLLTAMPAPGRLATERFATTAQRVARIDEIHRAIEEWTSTLEVSEVVQVLQHLGVAAAPVTTTADLATDPHFRERGTFVEVTHPLGFKETIYGAYVKMSRTTPQIRPGPAVGQDNEYVFKKLLGLSDERYEELVARKVIF